MFDSDTEYRGYQEDAERLERKALEDSRRVHVPAGDYSAEEFAALIDGKSEIVLSAGVRIDGTRAICMHLPDKTTVTLRNTRPFWVGDWRKP